MGAGTRSASKHIRTQGRPACHRGRASRASPLRHHPSPPRLPWIANWHRPPASHRSLIPLGAMRVSTVHHAPSTQQRPLASHVVTQRSNEEVEQTGRVRKYHGSCRVWYVLLDALLLGAALHSDPESRPAGLDVVEMPRPRRPGVVFRVPRLRRTPNLQSHTGSSAPHQTRRPSSPLVVLLV